jgi:hypothetical protein
LVEKLKNCHQIEADWLFSSFKQVIQDPPKDTWHRKVAEAKPNKTVLYSLFPCRVNPPLMQ